MCRCVAANIRTKVHFSGNLKVCVSAEHNMHRETETLHQKTLHHLNCLALAEIQQNNKQHNLQAPLLTPIFDYEMQTSELDNLML